MIILAFKKHPFFIPAIPLFFVLHGYLDNFGFIAPGDAIWVVGAYWLGAGITYLLLWLVFRDKTKAALMTAWLLTVYFFFGAYHDFLIRYASFLSKYSVLLPLLLVLSAAVWIWVRKARSLQRAMLLVNLIFIVYLGLDTVLLTARYIDPPVNELSLSSYGLKSLLPIPKEKRPDIYLLIFDEYGSSLSLQENYGYHNDLDAYLQQKGFRIQTKSYSNYNYTLASVASILNMSYIKGIRDSMLYTVKDMNNSLQLIRDNIVADFLSEQGYGIVNCSYFDLPKAPTAAEETLLPVKTRLITCNTLWSKIFSDLGWMLFIGPHQLQWLTDREYYTPAQRNAKLLEMIKAQSRRKTSDPVFVYGHLYMPHPPYYYDKNNHLKTKEVIEAERLQKKGDARPLQPYLEYLTHTNTEIRKLIDTIQQNTQGKAVVILMGDHGFRRRIYQDEHCNYQNMNAVYVPGGDYRLFYDSMTCVNQFRVVFNTVFGQSIPLLKDSTIFLTDKQ